MNEIRDYQEGKFEPWLLQVLEHHLPYRAEQPKRCTLEEAKTALKNGEDPLQFGDNLPRKVAQYIDDRTGWHYMGNAEYEFGSIPSAIKNLFGQDLVTGEFDISKKKLPKSFSRGNSYYHEPAKKLRLEENKPPEKRDKALIKALKAEIESGPQEDLHLYYLGPKKYLDKIPGLFDKLCKNTLRTKAGTRFDHMADPLSEEDRRYHGWLCLDFPFWMTKDKKFFDELVALYIGGS